MSDELRSSVTFVCFINPHVVTKFCGVQSVRTRNAFAPAIHARAALADGVREYEVFMPVSVADANNFERLDAIRKQLHEQLDKSFEEFKARWEKAQQLAKAKDEQVVKKLEVVKEEPQVENVGAEAEGGENGDGTSVATGD